MTRWEIVLFATLMAGVLLICAGTLGVFEGRMFLLAALVGSDVGLLLAAGLVAERQFRRGTNVNVGRAEAVAWLVGAAAALAWGLVWLLTRGS